MLQADDRAAHVAPFTAASYTGGQVIKSLVHNSSAPVAQHSSAIDTGG